MQVSRRRNFTKVRIAESLRAAEARRKALPAQLAQKGADGERIDVGGAQVVERFLSDVRCVREERRDVVLVGRESVAETSRRRRC